MDAIWQAGAAGSPPALPPNSQPGYPTGGPNPTVPGPWWFHMMTQEIRNAIAAAGITPDPEQLNQLDAAIVARAAAAAASVNAALQSFRATVGAFPLNNLLAGLGDSITAQSIANGVISGISTDSRATRNQTRGYLHWAAALSRGVFRSPQSMNFGVSGETSAQIAARVGAVVAAKPGVCVVLAGTNDIGALTYSQTIANLTTIYTALARANIVIIAIPILPRDLGGNAAQSLFVQRVNRWIVGTAPLLFSGFHVADARYLYGDPTSSSGGPRAGMAYDSALHPSGIGAKRIGSVVADILNVLRPQTNAAIFSSIWDYYDATNNPTGSILPNSILGGASGTKLDANTSGTVANNFQAGFSAGGGTISGLYAACGPDFTSYGGSCQKIVITGTATGGYQTVFVYEQFNFSNLGDGSLVAGDTIEAVAEIEVEGGAIGISGVSLYVSTTENGNVFTQHDGYPIVSDDYTTEGFKAVLRTPQRTLTANNTQASAGLWIYFKNSGDVRSFTLKPVSIAVRKVL